MTAKEAKSAKTADGGDLPIPSDPLVLFSPAGSLNLFLREMRTAGGAAGFPITFEATFPIRLNPGSIDGSPAAAGGCLLVVDDDFIGRLYSVPDSHMGYPSVPFRRVLQTEPEVVLEPVESARKRFEAMIRAQGNYGVRFAFLSDGPVAERLLASMRAQAAQEAAVQADAHLVLAEHSGLNDPGVPLDVLLKREKAEAARAKAAQA
jgi:hypothetical protein